MTRETGKKRPEIMSVKPSAKPKVVKIVGGREVHPPEIKKQGKL